jgi:mono/diheme cytochrome c family protein
MPRSDGARLTRSEFVTLSVETRVMTVNTAEKKLKRGWQLLPSIVIACIVVSGAGQQNQTAPKTAEQFTRLIRSVEGPDLFRAYCAPCHGVDGKGAGPAAPALRVKPPDLTLLARSNRGPFPKVRVRQMIMGDQVAAAHGSRERDADLGTHLSPG